MILAALDRIAATFGHSTTSRSMVADFGRPPHIEHADVLSPLDSVELMCLADDEHLYDFVARKRIETAQTARMEGASR